MKALPLLVPALLALACPAAHADDRATVVSLGGMFGVQSTSEYSSQGAAGPRLVLSFEHAPLPFPETPGYNVGFSFVPELVAGLMIDNVKGEGQVGVGGRIELDMTQKEMGLLKVSARAGFYLGAHAIVAGDQRTVFPEITIGEYFYLGHYSKTRLGFEGVFTVRKGDTLPQPDSPPLGYEYGDDASRPGASMFVYLGRTL